VDKLRLVAAAALAAAACAGSRAAAAEERALTLDAALALARERGPAIRASRAGVDEARARLLGASLPLRDNPQFVGAAGRRASDGGDHTDGEIGVSQTFEIGGKRGARVDGARAAVAGAVSSDEEFSRSFLREVAVAFYEALHAEGRMGLSTAAEDVALEVLRVAERRQSAGDASLLEVNLARVAQARTRSERRAAEAGLLAAYGELRGLLGLGPAEPFRLEGELRSAGRFTLEQLQASVQGRADLRLLAARSDEARAERRLGQAERWPDLGLGVRYQRDEGDDVVLGTLAITLPLFERGQGRRAEADARLRRLDLELEAGQRRAESDVRTAFDVHARRLAAVFELEGEALGLIEQNETMARLAYDVGQFRLSELLLVRREALELRREHLDRLLEAAIAGVDLQWLAGVLR